MNVPHEISTRIQFAGENGSVPDSPRWTRVQVQRMLGKSPLLDIQVLRLIHNDQYRWRPDFSRTDCFGKDDLAMLFHIMGCAESELHGEMEVKTFSGLCSAMWYLRVVPDRIRDRTPSRVIERTVEWNSVSNTWNTPKDILLARDPELQLMVDVNAGEESIRCWNRQVRESQETSYQLANIAFVLCWKEVFAEEMKTVVWNWTRTVAATMDPIECLEIRSRGKYERKSLDTRRSYEMKKIRTWFNDYIKSHKPPDRIATHVQERLNVNPQTSDETIYAWIKSVERGCGGSRSSADQNGLHPRVATNASEGSQKKSKGKSHQHHRGGPSKKGSGLRKYLDQLASKVPEEELKYAEDMLSEANKFIQSRQQYLVDEMLSWRAAQVADWERILEGTELVDEFQGLNGNARMGTNGDNLSPNG
ncbi:hypothetical protein BKA64DRAFT_751899 [Cadophora sp. MPI-SDFR-AT-0126]|nr:hypothetical protein BKA64DRAFT_751899 [Leotiomycetes sp. MPI-SDFR-AT-0126]